MDQTKRTEFQSRSLLLLLLRFHGNRVLLKSFLLLRDISLYRIISTGNGRVGSATGLKLVDLPIFIVLEFVHVPLESVTVCVGFSLLLLRRLYSSFQRRDSLLQLLDLGTEL
jgi:hypothetical protein